MMTRQMWKKIGVLLMLAASTLQLEAAKVMYARLADNSQTMTFYYDEDYQEGTDMPITAFANSGLRGWNSHAADFQSCTQLKRIEMTYLTPGTSLKDISRMFANYTALETIICNADFSPVAKGKRRFTVAQI